MASIKPISGNPHDVLLLRIVPMEVAIEILHQGELCPPSENNCSSYDRFSLAKPNMISKRQSAQIPILDYCSLHECLAFYFAPLSPMLYSIFKKKEDGVQYDIKNIVYIVLRIKTIVDANIPFAFSDVNAVLGHAKFENDLKQLFTLVDFAVMDGKYWNNTTEDRNRKERRMAEFLIKGRISLSLVSHFVTFDKERQLPLQPFLEQGTYSNIKLVVKPDWYYQ